MGIEHLINTMNKDTERGFLAYSLTLHILTQFNHWPTEAIESNPLKLPMLRILRLASNIQGLELDNFPPILHNNDIAASLRAASQAVDEIHMGKRQTLQGTMGTKDYDTLVRQQYKLIRYSNTLLKHLAPLWETSVCKWNNQLTIKHTSPITFTYHIQPTDATLAKLPQGQRASPKTQLRTAIDTL
jgi:hypothetical protein